MPWFKGNTHAHTTNSDGDSSPDVVVAWYEAHGYDFLALSDHNVLTPPKLDRPVSLTMLPAEELTLPLSVHVNGLGLTSRILPMEPPLNLSTRDSKRWLVRAAIAAIEAQGALAHVNHPNYNWALNVEILEAVSGMRYLEVFNGHPAAENEGDKRHAGAERQWDHLLAAGKLIYAMATDDAHHYKRDHPIYANPGRGWIWVQAADARPESILGAMHAGQFYASTGITLAGYEIRGRELCVVLDDELAAIELMGSGGRVLEHEDGCEARFTRPSGEPYVRVRVTGQGNRKAWLQPLMMSAS